MPNIVSFPSVRFQQTSFPQLQEARDQMVEIFAKLEEIRLAMASLSQGGDFSRDREVSHEELKFDGARDRPAIVAICLSDDGA